MVLRDIVEAMGEAKAAQAHLVAGMPIIFRVDGTLNPARRFGKLNLDAAFIEALIAEMPEQEQIVQSRAERQGTRRCVDIEGQRVIAHIYSDAGKPALTLHWVPKRIPALFDLHLPSIVEKITYTRRGLILVAGDATSGKVTTAYAMLNHINLNRSERVHVLSRVPSYELRSKMSLVTQQTVGIDVVSYESSLQSIADTDIDVVVVDDVPPAGAAVAVLRLAEQGRLVIAMAPASNVDAALKTVVDRTQLPRDVACSTLSRVLQASIAQRLLTGLAGRVAVHEVLIATQEVRERLATGVTDMRDIMEQQPFVGMQTMDRSIVDAYHRGVLSYDTAASHVRNPKDLQGEP